MNNTLFSADLFRQWLDQRQFTDRLIKSCDDEIRLKKKLDRLLFIFCLTQNPANKDQASYLYQMIEIFKLSVDTQSMAESFLH